VTEPAFDAGVVSLPDPRVAADSPARGWLWRGVMMMSYQNPGGAEIQNWNFPGHVAFEVRSMRKVDRGILTFIVSKTVIQGSAFDVDVSGLIRILCLT